MHRSFLLGRICTSNILFSFLASRSKILLPSGVQRKASSYVPSPHHDSEHHHTSPSRSIAGNALSNCMGELRAQDFLQALLSMPSAATLWHNHHYDFSLLPDGPDPPSAPYYDRLAWIRPDPQNNQAKRLPPTYIEGYEIKVDIFPNAKVIISIPSADRPLPFPNTEELANEFLIFLGQIRGYIQRCLSDKRGVLVPSALSWRLVHADINKDVLCSPKLFLTFPKMEMTRAVGVFLSCICKNAAWSLSCPARKRKSCFQSDYGASYCFLD
jgi:hypothetical protein